MMSFDEFLEMAKQNRERRAPKIHRKKKSKARRSRSLGLCKRGHSRKGLKTSACPLCVKMLYEARREVFNRAERGSKELQAEWEAVLATEGLAMNRAEAFNPIQFEEYEDPSLYFDRRGGA